MARKSVFHGGKYDGVSVQQLLDLKQYGFLRWCYYNYSMISFLPDILTSYISWRTGGLKSLAYPQRSTSSFKKDWKESLRRK